MSGDFRDRFQEIVGEAVLNKYPEFTVADLELEFKRVWGRSRARGTEDDVRLELRPIATPQDDVNNQIVVLDLINRFWSHRSCVENPLSTLNSGLFGRIGAVSFRSREEVEDYGGQIPTEKEGVRERLDELERFCRHIVDEMRDSSLAEQCRQLAYVHGAVIRVHPFEDGNGRTARFFIQLALMSWGLRPTPLPKVRNDSAWANAMKRAVSGNARALTNQLILRIGRANDIQ